ncbi:MAG: ankyrin repeat domain-containing protein [Candidatus Symbiodolus clandestinus]
MDSISNEERIALFYALFKHRKELVEFLLGRKTNVNTQGGQGNTPLHFAAKFIPLNQEGGSTFIDLLIKHGGQIDKKNFS